MPSLVLGIQQTARLLDRVLDPLMGELALNTADVPVLVLATRPGGTTIAQLRYSFGYPASTLTTILARLERDELLQRSRTGIDGRAVVVVGSRRGRAVSALAMGAVAVLEERIALRAGEDAVAGCHAVLEASREPTPPDR